MVDINIEKIKKEFIDYRTTACFLRKKREELCAIKAKLGTHGIHFSDLPKSNPQSDKILYLLQEKIEIESAIRKTNKKRVSERNRLTKILKDLDSDITARRINRKTEILTAEASVLKLRYLCGFNWDEINYAFYGGDNDFNDSADVYLKRIFRYHGQAFSDLVKMMRARQKIEECITIT